MRGGVARAALLAAASLKLSGAQQLDAKSILAESKTSLAFDPFAALRAVGLDVGNREGKPKIAKRAGLRVFWRSYVDGRGRGYANQNNAEKRKRRAAMARLKGCPGGWKKAVRQIDAHARIATAA